MINFSMFSVVANLVTNSNLRMPRDRRPSPWGGGIAPVLAVLSSAVACAMNRVASVKARLPEGRLWFNEKSPDLSTGGFLKSYQRLAYRPVETSIELPSSKVT